MAKWSLTIDIASLWQESKCNGGAMEIDEFAQKIAGAISTALPDRNDRELDAIIESMEIIIGNDIGAVREFDSAWAFFSEWANEHNIWIEQ